MNRNNQANKSISYRFPCSKRQNYLSSTLCNKEKITALIFEQKKITAVKQIIGNNEKKKKKKKKKNDKRQAKQNKQYKMRKTKR